MLRNFAEHDVRVVDSLDGRWDFVVEPERKERGAVPKRYPRTIQVPSAWECLPDLQNYRGRGWLRTQVAAYEGMALRLVFGGVSHTATVRVDGRVVGRHEDAFTPFDVVVTGLKTGLHELVVACDNSFGDHSALHIQNDYYTYGGITRPVEAHTVPPVYIRRLWATPRAGRGGSWSLDVRVWLHNWTRKPLRRGLRVRVAGAELALAGRSVAPGETREVTGTIERLDVKPWHAGDPKLYDVEAELFDDAEICDDCVERVGFRTIAVKGKRLLLNGRSLRLRGVNRHEDHGQFGNALPVEAMAADLELIRHAGGNFVRTCHYPNDQRFLDLCDEMGVYVWEESHARNVQFDHPRFHDQILASTREMVEWHQNHPSIVIWGCLNECDSLSVAGRKVHAEVLKLIRSLDPTRPRTFASNKLEQDICLGLVDILSVNMYTGWYEGYGLSLSAIETRLASLLKWLHSPRSRGGRGKPLIVSEFGGAALYGVRNPLRRQMWSEEYQSDLLDECLRVYLNHPDVVGTAIWQFCDCRVTDRWNTQTRPRGHNNKGIVDEFRRPKLSFETVRRRMLEAAKRQG
jgi:beta-glucuronidase